MDTKKILLTLIASALLLVSCDKLSVNELIKSAPQIESISPLSGSIGNQVVVTGSNLETVVGATIGGEKVEIAQRVSDTKIILTVTENAKSGVISLSNAVGSSESEQSFTMEYPTPVINADKVDAEVEMADNLFLTGQHLNTVGKVLFTAQGQTEAHEGSIVSQNDKEILVKVPFVEADYAKVEFQYFDGTKQTVTTVIPEGKIRILRYQPNVTSVSAGKATVGESITLSGDYMNKIEKVSLGSIDCFVSQQTENSLKFIVPTSDALADGDNNLALSITYFDGREQKTLNPNFNIFVPYVYHWIDKKLYAQGRDVEEFASFFSPETGLVYSNSDWRTIVDPVSYANQANNCSANQVPKTDEQTYNSVKPYFFFAGVSAGNLQINSPAGSASMLKNFYFYNNSANDYRVTGANANCYGTPVMTYLYLDPSVPAMKALADRVKNGEIDRIDASTFPINAAEKKMGDISISGLKASLNDAVFAPGVFSDLYNETAKDKDRDAALNDAVILVVYYNVKGSTLNVADNIKRIGFLHIKRIHYVNYNNTKAPSTSSIVFDMYWQKHDM